VPELQAAAIGVRPARGADRTDARVLGYPGGGQFVSNPARIREVIELSGPDIYRTTTVKREGVRDQRQSGQGDSGGPLIDLNSRVLGISFGQQSMTDTGFVLTASQVYAQMISVNADFAACRHRCLRQLTFSGPARTDQTPDCWIAQRLRSRRTASRSRG